MIVHADNTRTTRLLATEDKARRYIARRVRALRATRGAVPPAEASTARTRSPMHVNAGTSTRGCARAHAHTCVRAPPPLP